MKKINTAISYIGIGLSLLIGEKMLQANNTYNENIVKVFSIDPNEKGITPPEILKENPRYVLTDHEKRLLKTIIRESMLKHRDLDPYLLESIEWLIDGSIKKIEIVLVSYKYPISTDGRPSPIVITGCLAKLYS